MEENMRLLSRSEEIILLSVLKLEGDAYGISIREHIRKATGNEWSFASIYEPLQKLAQKGYLKKRMGKPTSERGGRHKFLYEITKDGRAALAEINQVYKNIWKDISTESLS
jgi:DNA-binding PadR family transcriptional regulator